MFDGDTMGRELLPVVFGLSRHIYNPKHAMLECIGLSMCLWQAQMRAL